jgi:2-polyprenyl-3-methyl-5-hydroxy-6-metoxy-1,4-benzoquinol methylase
MENLLVCPVCESNRLTKEISCKDYVASGELFDLVRCAECTFLFTNPRPAINEIGPYYQSGRYVSHAGDKSGFSFIYKVYDLVRDYSIKQKLRHIKYYHPKGNLMDLGCGLGYFLHGVHLDKTFNVVGVDVSDEAIDYVKNKFGYEVKNESELDNFNAHSFDVITQWHVLEHVHLLNERMVQLKRLIKPDGTLFIAVPNSDSWDAKNYGVHWDGYDVPRHLYHFNQQSFQLLMKKHGFKIVETKAMIFDAPYISMRSEVHRGNKIEFLRGAISGAISTVSAWGSKDYSSLLFVVKPD